MAKHEYDVCGVLKVSETSQGAKDKTSDYILEMDLRVVLLGTKRDSEFSESSHALIMASVAPWVRRQLSRMKNRGG